MLNIDFLPEQYHRRRARRQSKPWLALVSVAFVCLVALAAGAQYRDYHRLQAERDQLEPQYQQALAQKSRLDALQKELQTVQAEAALLAYLRHPWPRTQLLHAILSSFPDEITLTRLVISGETLGPKTAQKPQTPTAGVKDAVVALSAAEHDLTHLRDRADSVQTVIRMAGTTTDTGALHRYLGALADNPLFSKAELEAIESHERGTTGDMLFEATLVVHPGYGQPGGPTEPPTETLAGRLQP